MVDVMETPVHERRQIEEYLRSQSEDAWVLEVIRRLDVAAENLDRARDVEDFQAVGMLLRLLRRCRN
jgi:hypothetical protein